MKAHRLLAAAAAGALALAPSGAVAGAILPSLYASSYCQNRAMGLSASDSHRLAKHNSWSSIGETIYVTWDGRQVRADVLEASQLIQQWCPGR